MAASNYEIEMMEKARGRASFDSEQLGRIIYGSAETFENSSSAPSRIKPLSESLSFIQIIRSEGSDEQKRYWLPLAESGKVIGTYAHDELGQRALTRRIETTATYDENAGAFVIQSPTVTSTKIWPVEQIIPATYAVITARLFISSNDYGPHSFLLPIRCIQTLRCLPGIELGEKEPKASNSLTKNSYATFDAVRIPRMNMLMGLAQVQRDGTYSCKSQSTSAGKDALLLGRCRIVNAVVLQLAQAVTIVTRFSTVKTKDHGHYFESPFELPINCKKSQHAPLLGLQAQACVLLFASKTCTRILEDQASSPTDIQALTAGLTAYATEVADSGTGEARRCCEEHGDSVRSGLPRIASSVAAQCSQAGGSLGLYEQTARWLMKQVWPMKQRKDTHPSVVYLAAQSEANSRTSTGPSQPNNDPPADKCHSRGRALLTWTTILDSFKHRARRLIHSASRAMTASTARERYSLGARKAWNTHTLLLTAAARAHIELFALDASLAYMQRIQDPRTAHVVQLQLQLFALNTILASAAFFEDGYFDLAQADEMRGLVNGLHDALLPEAIALTDAWAFSDAELESAIGGWDGNVHETLMKKVRGLSGSERGGEKRGVDRGKRGESEVEPVSKMMEETSKL